MDYIGKVEEMPISLLSVNPSEIIVVHIDLNKYDIETAGAVYDMIKSRVSETVNFIGLPSGVDLTVEDIDSVISYLLEIKNDLLH